MKISCGHLWWVSEYKRGMDMVLVSMGKSKFESVHWKENPTEISLWEVSRDILKTFCAIKDTVKINPCCKNSYTVFLVLNCGDWNISHTSINHNNQGI